MNKQELIEGLKTKRKLMYGQHRAAYMEWKDHQSKYGSGDLLTHLSGEKMEVLSTKIDDTTEFIELLESLED